MWLLTTDAPVAWIGTAQSPDGTADVLEVKPPRARPRDCFSNQGTHMPLMLTTTGGGGRGFGRRRGAGRTAPPLLKARLRRQSGRPRPPPPGGAPAAGDVPRRGGPQGGQPITIETHLSDYKAENGIKMPHLITRGVNGQTSEESDDEELQDQSQLQGEHVHQMKRILVIEPSSSRCSLPPVLRPERQPGPAPARRRRPDRRRHSQRHGRRHAGLGQPVTVTSDDRGVATLPPLATAR